MCLNPLGKLGELSLKWMHKSHYLIKKIYIYTHIHVSLECASMLRLWEKSKLLKLASLSNEIFSSNINIPRDHFWLFLILCTWKYLLSGSRYFLTQKVDFPCFISKNEMTFFRLFEKTIEYTSSLEFCSHDGIWRRLMKTGKYDTSLIWETR